MLMGGKTVLMMDLTSAVVELRKGDNRAVRICTGTTGNIVVVKLKGISMVDNPKIFANSCACSCLYPKPLWEK